MSMVYDPVTREFRPRETRGVKPLAAGGTVATPPATTGAGEPRSRRRQNVRHLRRRRELLFWLLVTTVAGALIWCTLLIAKSLRPRYPEAERPIIDRFWPKAGDSVGTKK
jgi:hypothetical protein